MMPKHGFPEEFIQMIFSYPFYQTSEGKRSGRKSLSSCAFPQSESPQASSVHRYKRKRHNVAKLGSSQVTMSAPLIPSDMPAEIGMVQLNDEHAPFIVDAVNSKMTDPPSIREGEFIVENIAIAQSLKDLREKLQQRPELQGINFSITHFENWGKTVKSLLLYVKPKTRKNVCDIIRAAKELNIKVSCFDKYMMRCQLPLELYC